MAGGLCLGPVAGLLGDGHSVGPVVHVDEVVPGEADPGRCLPEVLGAAGVDEDTRDGGHTERHGEDGRTHRRLAPARLEADADPDHGWDREPHPAGQAGEGCPASAPGPPR